MSNNGAATATPMRELVAEEVRVLLARRRISASELARRAGLTQSYLARRMSGDTAFDVDDLQRISTVLGVPVSALLPAEVRPNVRSTSMAVRTTPKRRTATSRPPGRPANASTGPQSPIPPSRRRPTPVGPPSRPMH